jgi:hypothetical protein
VLIWHAYRYNSKKREVYESKSTMVNEGGDFFGADFAKANFFSSSATSVWKLLDD